MCAYYKFSKLAVWKQKVSAIGAFSKQTSRYINRPDFASQMTEFLIFKLLKFFYSFFFSLPSLFLSLSLCLWLRALLSFYLERMWYNAEGLGLGSEMPGWVALCLRWIVYSTGRDPSCFPSLHRSDRWFFPERLRSVQECTLGRGGETAVFLF